MKRFEKTKEEQQERTKKFAEVFTPLWVIDKMVSEVTKNRKNLVEKTYLEICCGEGHFITSRYDPHTGELVPEPERVGVLDRKLRACRSSTDTWKALKSVYGYEIQEDSLAIARENVKQTFLEWFDKNTNIIPLERAVDQAIAERFVLMDGLTYRNPLTGEMTMVADPESGKMIKFADIVKEGKAKDD